MCARKKKTSCFIKVFTQLNLRLNRKKFHTYVSPIVNDTPNDEKTMEPKQNKKKKSTTTTTTQESVRFDSFRAKIYQKYDEKSRKKCFQQRQQQQLAIAAAAEL